MVKNLACIVDMYVYDLSSSILSVDVMNPFPNCWGKVKYSKNFMVMEILLSIEFSCTNYFQINVNLR